MWPEVERAFARQVATLRDLGVQLDVRLHPGTAMYSFTQGADIYVAMPDTSDRGQLQAALLGAVMGLTVDEVRTLALGSVERLIGHELGHALRQARGRFTDDVLEEERAADAVAQVLAPRSPALEPLLAKAVAHGGRLSEAAALHRHRDRLAPRFGPAPADAAETFRATYHRDVHRFSHVMTAWTWLDLVHPGPETWQEVADVWL